MKIPTERCEWLMKDKIAGGGTTMQDYELAEDLLEARKQLSDLQARLKKANVNVAEMAQELLDARQKIAKLIDLFDKTADHHCSGMCGHDDYLKKKDILTHDEWVKYAEDIMREVENADKN